jgi:hypothetical protein
MASLETIHYRLQPRIKTQRLKWSDMSSKEAEEVKDGPNICSSCRPLILGLTVPFPFRTRISQPELGTARYDSSSSWQYHSSLWVFSKCRFRGNLDTRGPRSEKDETREFLATHLFSVPREIVIRSKNKQAIAFI